MLCSLMTLRVFVIPSYFLFFIRHFYFGQQHFSSIFTKFSQKVSPEDTDVVGAQVLFVLGRWKERNFLYLKQHDPYFGSKYIMAPFYRLKKNHVNLKMWGVSGTVDQYVCTSSLYQGNMFGVFPCSSLRRGRRSCLLGFPRMLKKIRAVRSACSRTVKASKCFKKRNSPFIS